MPEPARRRTGNAEIIQGEVTSKKRRRGGVDPPTNVERRAWIRGKLTGVVELLGAPGASHRAAEVLRRPLELEDASSGPGRGIEVPGRRR